jgi:hypothetical protein
MGRGKVPVFFLLLLFAASPAAGLVCEVTCAVPTTAERRAPARPAEGSAGCHSAATTDPDTPAVRLSPAAAGHCEHSSDHEAINAERVQTPDSRRQALDAIDASRILPCRESPEPVDRAFRHSPQGPRIGFGLAIRV